MRSYVKFYVKAPAITTANHEVTYGNLAMQATIEKCCLPAPCFRELAMCNFYTQQVRSLIYGYLRAFTDLYILNLNF